MKYLAILLSLISTAAFANDLMYPPAPAAEKSIQIDGQGFIINGRRTYVASGTIHYARVPHELWRDRLLRLKRAGFNCVETYAFWNFHEPKENQWDFTGDKDFGAFLDTAKELGLYAIVRAGPYVCAEWDSGGYPVWLKFKPPMRVRTADPEYLKWNDHWYGKILPIVAARQIHKGGNVIMVQLENEHPLGWGTVTGDPYFDHLRQKAIECGIEVPYFFSGLNHGSGPWPRSVAGRTTPWFSTEFWPGWFDLYGNLAEKRFKEVERDNWRILAHGGAGHNFYMLHGGSNFETWNDDSGAASYDYGAAIGQCGDLRPIYYRMKRANMLAQLLPAMRAAGAKIEFDGDRAKSFAGTADCRWRETCLLLGANLRRGDQRQDDDARRVRSGGRVGQARLRRQATDRAIPRKRPAGARVHDRRACGAHCGREHGFGRSHVDRSRLCRLRPGVRFGYL